MKSAPHGLVIEAYHKDDDLYDYTVQHPASCPREVVSDTDLGAVGTSYFHYTCLVQHELDHVGLDSLTEFGEKPLEPGEYVIEGWSEFYERDGDADGGLRFLGGDGNQELALPERERHPERTSERGS